MSDEREEFLRVSVIDPSQLDVECVQQADTFFTWAEKLVEAKSEVEKRKQDLDAIESRLALKVRESPEQFGLEAKTEAAYKACVQTQKKFLDAEESLWEAKKRAAWLEQCVTTLEQKKRMLETLTTLHGQQYFAGPSVPRNLVEAWQDHQKVVSDRVNERQSERARRRVRQGRQ